VEVLGRKAAVVVKQAGAPHGNAPPGKLAGPTRPTRLHRLCFAIAAKKRVDGNRNAMQRWDAGREAVIRSEAENIATSKINGFATPTIKPPRVPRWHMVKPSLDREIRWTP